MTRKFMLKGMPLLMILVFFSQMATAQEAPPLIEDYNYQHWRRAIAKWQINSLQSGVVLVRLKTNQSAIDQLRNAGNTKYADKVEKEQKEANDKLIAAFQSDFDFCDVYFFKSEHSQLVRDHKLDSIPFVAKILLNPEVGKLNPASYFLVAELTTLAPDALKQADNQHPQVKSTDSPVSYSSNSNFGIPALVFKSDQFVQLDGPFPYYVRTYKSINFFVKRPMSKVVEIANSQLHEFFGYKMTQASTKKKKRKK